MYPISALVNVYAYPNSIVNTNGGNNSKSTQYRVMVTQDGTTQECYVMFDKNQDPNGNLKNNPDNHWTNFSYNGTVTVTVEKQGNAINSCIVHPKKKGIKASITGGKASFTITENLSPLQVYVEVDNKPMDVLLIYCDPPETDVPDMNGTDVTVINTSDNITTVRNKLNDGKTYSVFEKGIHTWGGGNGEGYEGYKLPVKSGKKIYIPGGAYVIGSFYGNKASNFKIYGRGVISACGKNILPGTGGIPYSLIYTDNGGSNQSMEGLILTDPPHFCLTLRTTGIIDNIKMMAWFYSCDGIIAGDDSKITNCFFKVMDDGIKLYSPRMYCENNTMYPQVNGAPFQFCWGSQNGDDCVVKNTYIVSCSFKPSLTGPSNTAIINAVTGPGNGVATNGHTFDGIFIDNGCQRLIGIDAENKGTYNNWTIKNVEINTQNKNPQQSYSYLLNGNFNNWKIINLTINGKRIYGVDINKDDPNNGKIWFKGNTGAVTFSHDPVSVSHLYLLKLSPGSLSVFPAIFDNRLIVISENKPEVYNVTGRKLDIDYSAFNDRYTFNTSRLSHGIYVITSQGSAVSVIKR